MGLCATGTRGGVGAHILSQPPPSPEDRPGGDYSDVAVPELLCKFGSPASRQRVPALSRCALKAWLARRHQKTFLGGFNGADDRLKARVRPVSVT
jgi:hypothetical protein